MNLLSPSTRASATRALSDAFSHRPGARPHRPTRSRPPGPMDRGFDQGPPQPRRAAARDAPVADTSGTGVDARNQPRVAGELPGRCEAADVADLSADGQRRGLDQSHAVCCNAVAMRIGRPPRPAPRRRAASVPWARTIASTWRKPGHTRRRPAAARRASRPASRQQTWRAGARPSRPLTQQHRPQRLITAVRTCTSAWPLATQLAQLSNRQRRVVDADHAVAAERVRQPPRIEPVGLRRIARLQLRLQRVDDPQVADRWRDARRQSATWA